MLKSGTGQAYSRSSKSARHISTPAQISESTQAEAFEQSFLRQAREQAALDNKPTPEMSTMVLKGKTGDYIVSAKGQETGAKVLTKDEMRDIDVGDVQYKGQDVIKTEKIPAGATYQEKVLDEAGKFTGKTVTKVADKDITRSYRTKSGGLYVEGQWYFGGAAVAKAKQMEAEGRGIYYPKQRIFVPQDRYNPKVSTTPSFMQISGFDVKDTSSTIPPAQEQKRDVVKMGVLPLDIRGFNIQQKEDIKENQIAIPEVSGFELKKAVRPGYEITGIKSTPEGYTMEYREKNPDIGWMTPEQAFPSKNIVFDILASPISSLAKQRYAEKKAIEEEYQGKVLREGKEKADIWKREESEKTYSTYDVTKPLDTSKILRPDTRQIGVISRITQMDIPYVDIELGHKERTLLTGAFLAAPILSTAVNAMGAVGMGLKSFISLGTATSTSIYLSERGVSPLVTNLATIGMYMGTYKVLTKVGKYTPSIEYTKIDLSKTDATIGGGKVYRGFSVETKGTYTEPSGVVKPNKGYPLIGATEKKIVVGTPKLEVNIKPTGEIKPMVESDYLLSARTARAIIGGERAPQTNLQPFEFKQILPEKQADLLTSMLKKKPNIIEIGTSKRPSVFGSVAQKSQMGDVMTRAPHDIDISFKVVKAEKFATEFVQKSNALKGDGVLPTRIKPGETKLVEIYKDGKWSKVLDIHDITDVDVPRAAYGLEITEKSRKIGGIQYREISGEATAKMAAATQPRELGWQPSTPTETSIFDKYLKSYTEKGGTFGPAKHRLKDVGDYGNIDSYLVDVASKNKVSKLYKDTAAAKRALEVYKRTADIKFTGQTDETGFVYKPFSDKPVGKITYISEPSVVTPTKTPIPSIYSFYSSGAQTYVPPSSAYASEQSKQPTSKYNQLSKQSNYQPSSSSSYAPKSVPSSSKSIEPYYKSKASSISSRSSYTPSRSISSSKKSDISKSSLSSIYPSRSALSKISETSSTSSYKSYYKGYNSGTQPKPRDDGKLLIVPEWPELPSGFGGGGGRGKRYKGWTITNPWASVEQVFGGRKKKKGLRSLR